MLNCLMAPISFVAGVSLQGTQRTAAVCLVVLVVPPASDGGQCAPAALLPAGLSVVCCLNYVTKENKYWKTVVAACCFPAPFLPPL